MNQEVKYVYKLKNIDKEKLKELGYQPLPESICSAPDNENYYFKMVLQDTNADCVLNLIDFYNVNAEKICADKNMRAVHAAIGIKFRKKKKTGKYYLIMTPSLRMMFRAWRIELDLQNEDVYFTISDGSLPAFGQDTVIEKYCPEEIQELIINDLAFKEEVKQVQ